MFTSLRALVGRKKSSNPTTEIRRATSTQDHQDAVDFLHGSLPDEDLEHIAPNLDGGVDVRFWIATDHTGLVGALCISPLAQDIAMLRARGDLELADVLERRIRIVEAVAVVPSLRRRGIARQLFAAAEREAHEEDVRFLVLIFHWSEELRRTYQRLGYLTRSAGQHLLVPVFDNNGILNLPSSGPDYAWAVAPIHRRNRR